MNTDEELEEFGRRNELLDMMVQSGCDLPLRVRKLYYVQ